MAGRTYERVRAVSSVVAARLVAAPVLRAGPPPPNAAAADDGLGHYVVELTGPADPLEAAPGVLDVTRVIGRHVAVTTQPHVSADALSALPGVASVVVDPPLVLSTNDP